MCSDSGSLAANCRKSAGFCFNCVQIAINCDHLRRVHVSVYCLQCTVGGTKAQRTCLQLRAHTLIVRDLLYSVHILVYRTLHRQLRETTPEFYCSVEQIIRSSQSLNQFLVTVCRTIWKKEMLQVQNSSTYNSNASKAVDGIFQPLGRPWC